jgi:phosphopantetheinyl transferase
MILSKYLDLRPESIGLEQDQLDKPQVAGSRLWCSFSHSGGQGLVAVGWDSAFEVDIERGHCLSDAKTLKGACFNERERDHLVRSSDGSTLLRPWSRKKALLKSMDAGRCTAPRAMERCQHKPPPRKSARRSDRDGRLRRRDGCPQAGEAGRDLNVHHERLEGICGIQVAIRAGLPRAAR